MTRWRRGRKASAVRVFQFGLPLLFLIASCTVESPSTATPTTAKEAPPSPIPTVPSASEDTGTHYSLSESGITVSEAVQPQVAAIARCYFQKTGKDLVVTSGTRSAEAQAEAMFIKIKGGDDLSEYVNQGAVKKIKDAYGDGTQKGKAEADIVADMTAVIDAQIANKVYISRHLIAGAVDIRSRDMAEADKAAFNDCAESVEGVSVLDEGIPPHFHLQFEVAAPGDAALLVVPTDTPVSPTPRPTPTATTVAATATPAPTAVPSPTPQPSPTATPMPTPLPTATPTAAPSPTPRPTPTPSATPTPTPTRAPTSTPTPARPTETSPSTSKYSVAISFTANLSSTSSPGPYQVNSRASVSLNATFANLNVPGRASVSGTFQGSCTYTQADPNPVYATNEQGSASGNLTGLIISTATKQATDGTDSVTLYFDGPTYQYYAGWCGHGLGPTNMAELVLEHLTTGSPVDAGYPNVGVLKSKLFKPAGEAMPVSGTYKDNEKSIAYSGTITLTYVGPR